MNEADVYLCGLYYRFCFKHTVIILANQLRSNYTWYSYEVSGMILLHTLMEAM